MLPHVCEHDCANTDGSYECSCYDGYSLNNDLSSCTGTIVQCMQT